jgi:uncharacterized Tic20 family protein
MNESSIPPGIPVTPVTSDKDVQTWAMLCHLAGLCGIPFPSFGAILGPLVVWLIKRNDHPTIDAAGKEALNFHLSILIYSLALAAVGILTLWLFIGFLFLLLAAVVTLAGLVFAVIAAVKTSNGETYRYPLSLRFLR